MELSAGTLITPSAPLLNTRNHHLFKKNTSDIVAFIHTVEQFFPFTCFVHFIKERIKYTHDQLFVCKKKKTMTPLMRFFRLNKQTKATHYRSRFWFYCAAASFCGMITLEYIWRDFDLTPAAFFPVDEYSTHLYRHYGLTWSLIVMCSTAVEERAELF